MTIPLQDLKVGDMNEHGIEELRRQMEHAESRYAQARQVKDAAKSRLQMALRDDLQARAEASGIIFCVTKVMYRNYGSPAPRIIYGLSMGRNLNPVLTLSRVKNDGTLSQATCNDTMTLADALANIVGGK